MASVDDLDLLTRTTGFDAPSAGRSCRRCGHEIRGRRKNGYCSDRCRMRDNRERDAERRRGLVAQLREAVAAVERELLAGSGEEP